MQGRDWLPAAAAFASLVTVHVAVAQALPAVIGPSAQGNGALIPVSSYLSNLSPMSTALPGMQAVMRDAYLPVVTQAALHSGVPPALADAVAVVESSYNPGARGTSGEVGLMQILPPTARMLGFRGSFEELLVPETNIRLSVEYLSRAWAMSGGDICRALMKYRAGWGEEQMTPLSQLYCHRAMSWMTGRGAHAGGFAVTPGTAPGLPVADASLASGASDSDPYVVHITSAGTASPAPVTRARLRGAFPETYALQETNALQVRPAAYTGSKLRPSQLEALESRLAATQQDSAAEPASDSP